jgi:hypothetical protein
MVVAQTALPTHFCWLTIASMLSAISTGGAAGGFGPFFLKHFSLTSWFGNHIPRSPACFYSVWHVLAQAAWVVGLATAGFGIMALSALNWLGMIATRAVGKNALHWVYQDTAAQLTIAGGLLMAALGVPTIALLAFWAPSAGSAWGAWATSYFLGLLVEVAQIAVEHKTGCHCTKS